MFEEIVLKFCIQLMYLENKRMYKKCTKLKQKEKKASKNMKAIKNILKTLIQSLIVLLVKVFRNIIFIFFGKEFNFMKEIS